MALLLSGCTMLGIGEEEGEGGQAGEVVFWTSHGPPEIDTLKAMVDTYNREQDPSSPVKLVRVAGEETDVAKLMTAVRGGTGPDVYLLDRFTAAQRAESGLIVDLSDYMEQAGGVDQFAGNYVDFAWSEVQFEGKPYALPFDTDARALYYNKEMLRKGGVDPAELASSKGPVSLDRIRQIAFQLNKTDDAGQYTQVGFIPWYDQGWHYTWGFDFGGEFFDADSCRVTPTDPQIVDAFQWIYDWANEMNPKKAQSFLSTNAQCTGPMTCEAIPPQQHPFITGKLAMVVTGDWFIRHNADFNPDTEYGVTYIPSPTGQPSTWAGGWSMTIPTGAKNPDPAWEFMRWFAGPEGQRIYSEETSHMPTWNELLEDASLFTGPHTFFRGLLLDAKSRPPLPVGALYWDELTAAQEAVALNDSQPQPALEQVESRVQPQLEELCPLTQGAGQ